MTSVSRTSTSPRSPCLWPQRSARSPVQPRFSLLPSRVPVVYFSFEWPPRRFRAHPSLEADLPHDTSWTFGLASGDVQPDGSYPPSTGLGRTAPRPVAAGLRPPPDCNASLSWSVLLFPKLGVGPMRYGRFIVDAGFYTPWLRQRVLRFGYRIMNRQQTEEIAVLEYDPNVWLQLDQKQPDSATMECLPG